MLGLIRVSTALFRATNLLPLFTPRCPLISKSVQALKYFRINRGDKRFFSIREHHNMMLSNRIQMNQKVISSF